MFCKASTGVTFRKRKLFTNNQQTILAYCIPIIINGIAELPQSPDFLDRVLLIALGQILGRRLTEKEFWKAFNEAHPRLLGALLDVVCEGIRQVDQVQLSYVPRMADFAQWGAAVEVALGFQPGDFMAAYLENIEDAHLLAIESSPITRPIRAFLQSTGGRFDGTVMKLLQDLTAFVRRNEHLGGSQALVRQNKDWPKAANQLSRLIDHDRPNLRKMGVEVERGKNHAGRWISLKLGTMRDDENVNTVPAQDAVPEEVTTSVTM